MKPPTLESLMVQYLDRQSQSQALGLEPANLGDVVPHEAGPVQPIDAKAAWTEATPLSRAASVS